MRSTAKFRLFQQQSSNSQYKKITTKSIISAPHSSAYKFSWKRIFGEYVQNLSHLQNSLIYQCSQLDAESTIQLHMIPLEGTYLKQQKIKYGPIQKQDFITDSKEQYQVQMMTADKKYKCMIHVFSNRIQLSSQRVSFSGLYNISLQDIANCCVKSIENQTIIFPGLYERIIGLKLFNQILCNEGQYSDNNDPLTIKIYDKNNFHSLLTKINAMKIQRSIRGSQISTYANKKTQKPSIMSTQGIKTSTDDSFNSLIAINNKNNVKQIKKSQQDLKQNKQANLFGSQNQNPISAEDDINYVDEFENIIFSQQDQQQEALVLNDSFQEFQKNSKSNKQDLKLQEIKKRKRLQKKNYEQKLEIRLAELKKQKQQFSAANRKLKLQLANLSYATRNSNSTAIQQLKAEVYDLRTQLQRLQRVQIQQQQPFTPNKQPRFLNKYKSQRQIYGS